MPKTFKIPSVELPYLIGRKLFQMKLKDGFGDKTWADYFIFLTKQGNVKLRSTIDSVIEEGTMDHLLPMWMGNFAENLPYIRDGDVKIKKPKNSRTYTIADLAESTIEIDKHPPNSAIVIGRGPSVFNHNHLDILAKSDYKGAICATDGMLIECLKKHIIPTITVTVDGSPIIKKWFNHPLVKKHGQDIKIILPATVNNEVYQTCVRNKCKVFWYNPMFDIIFRNESFTRIANLMTRTKNTPKGLVTSQAGGNSGSATWIMAMALLKRAPICLIGMDLSYPEGTNLEETPYFSGVTKPEQVSFMYKKIYHPHFKTKALIDAVFWHYRKGFLEMQKSTPSWYRYYGGTINASEGGSIFGRFIKCMTFKNFLNKYPK